VAVGEHSYSPGLISPLGPTASVFLVSVSAQACSEGVPCGLHENFDCCERRSLQPRQTARRRDCAHVPLPGQRHVFMLTCALSSSGWLHEGSTCNGSHMA
jgi:hypothetical protein